jgi:hypothetical protein
VSLGESFWCSTGLKNLRWLHWPDIPPNISSLYQDTWPKLLLNAAAPPADVKAFQSSAYKGLSTFAGDRTQLDKLDQRVHSIQCPGSAHSEGVIGAADDDLALDALLLKHASPSALRHVALTPAEQYQQLHIADRFWHAMRHCEGETLRSRFNSEAFLCVCQSWTFCLARLQAAICSSHGMQSSMHTTMQSVA